MTQNKWHLLIAYFAGSFFGVMQVWALLSGLLRPRPAA